MKTPIDSAGANLLLYHGTATAFTDFDKDKVGSVHADIIRETGSYDDVDPTAFYFTNDPETAIWYAKDSAKKAGMNEQDGVILGVNLHMENPHIVRFGGTGREYLAEEIAVAKSKGCDSVVCRDFDDGGVSDHYIVFDTSRIIVVDAKTCSEFTAESERTNSRKVREIG